MSAPASKEPGLPHVSEQNIAHPTIEDFGNCNVKTCCQNPDIEISNSNAQLCLKFVPVRLQRHAIEKMMSRFGTVTEIKIPKNKEHFKRNGKDNMYVFVSFSKFGEAEKALRFINYRNTDGIPIKAELAYGRAVEHLSSFTQNEKGIKKDPEVKAHFNESETKPKGSKLYKIHDLPIVINVETDDPLNVFEKLTALERKNLETVEQQKKDQRYIEYLGKLAQTNFYNSETKRISYNPFPEELVLHNAICCLCGRDASLVCEKTSAYYCTIFCSKNIIEPFANMVIENNEVPFADPIKNNDLVVLTAVTSENVLYICKDDEHHDRLLNDVCRFAKHALPLECAPKIGDLVLACYRNEVFRAKVLMIHEHNNSISVQLIDFGNTARVFFDDLKKMELGCQQLQCRTLRVVLKNVNLPSIHMKIFDFLNKLVETKSILVAMNNDHLQMELVEKSTSINVNKRINELHAVEQLNLGDEGVVISDHSYETYSIPAGLSQKLFVTNISNMEENGIIACIAESKVKDLREMYKAINHYANNSQEKPNGLPASEQVYLAHCNGQWHRAILIERKGDGNPTMILLDIMNFQNVNIKDIIPMPKEFQRPYAPMSYPCKIIGFEKSEATKAVARSFIKENSFVVADEITIDSDDFFLLNFKEILKQV